MVSPRDIQGDDIIQWAGRIEASAVLPALVRRLLLASAPLESLSMPADGGVRLKGWDGVVTAHKQGPFWPAGFSVWELSVENGVRTKLNADFDKRTEQAPETLDKSRTTYVAVTARRFGQENKADWVEEKRQLGIWADVRVHDADDLATWLARTPAVACWFATTALGLPATDLTDVETYLRDWSGRGRTHPVPSELLVAGGERRRAMAFVRSALSESRPRALHVRGETHEEALGFVAAALMASAPDERERWLARTLIVESREAWRWALRSEQVQPLILLPAFADFDPGASSTRNAFVIVPEDARYTGHADVQLEPLPFNSFAQVLIESGVRASDAERLARDSGGKLSAYLTLAGYRTSDPAHHHEEGTQLALLLVGAWTPSNESDREVLKRLGAEPGKAERLCTTMSREPGTPIIADTERGKANAWRWTSSAEAWKRLGGQIPETLLRIFADLVLEVLGELDPRYDMLKEERVYAALFGKTLRHSTALREGLAESLVRLALSDEELKATHGRALGRRCADSIVTRLLTPEWKQWASLSGLLPTLAEAAPQSFMNALETSLDRGDAGVAHLLREEASFLQGSSPHTGLLWALETLGWSGVLMPRVADALIRLSEQDPGGQLSNRPLRSLTQLLHIMHAQTCASIDQCHQARVRLLQHSPKMGWRTLIKIVNNCRLSDFSPAQRPAYLPWVLPPEGPTISIEDAREQFGKLIELLQENAGTDIDKWVDLLELSSWAPEALAIRILDGTAKSFAVDGDTSGRIWSSLRDVLSNIHGQEVQKPANLLGQASALYLRLTPPNPVSRNVWLFHQWPKLPEPNMDSIQRRQRAEELRASAVNELWEQETRWEHIDQLAAHVQWPESLGMTLGQASFAEDAEARFIHESSLSNPLKRIFPAFVVERFNARKHDMQWLEHVLRTLLSRDRLEDAVQAVVPLRPSASLWNLLEQGGSELKSQYWNKVRWIRVDSNAEWEFAVRELLKVGRTHEAVTTAHDAKGDVSAATVLHSLEQFRESIRSGEHTPQRGDAYLIGQLFERVDQDPDIETARVLALEFFFFLLLKDTKRQAKHLYAMLDQRPDEFATLVEMIYREAGEPDSLGEDSDSARETARWLLSTWKGVPGQHHPTRVERDEYLLRWAETVLELTRASGYEGNGIAEVAKILARADTDGAWPCLTARQLLERPDSERLARNLRVAKYNLRGEFWKKVQDGGTQERELAATFRMGADTLRGDWPRTSVLLDELAEFYLHDAEREDSRARSERLKYGWEPETDHPVPSASVPEPTPTDTVGRNVERLEIQGIASAPAARLEFASRLNLLAGDNSTGKTLVLDVLWWARTASWAHVMAWPGPVKEGTPGATIRVGSPNTPDVESRFDATREQWSRPANWPTPRALALYARVDGGFSVWDPIRNDTSSTPGRADVLSAYRFTPEALWNGVEEHGKTWCNGLLRDWIDWQYRRTGLFDALKDVLAGLSPSDEPLRPGTPVRVSMHEARDIPTLELSYGTVPVIHASAAVRRVLGLAYLLVWSWNEHREAARLAGQPVAEQVLLLIDEVESHLHPKWQRLLLPALLRVIQRLAGEVQVQVVASTHAPLVMASLESHFERERDKVFHFALEQGRIVVEEQPWAMQGDAVGWLVSETFGLKQARSREAEQAIEAAEAYMRHEPLPGHETPEKLQQWLQAVLPGHDPFWPRWLVATGAVR